MKIPRRLLHLRGVRIYQSLISIKRENMAAGLSLHSSMYIHELFKLGKINLPVLNSSLPTLLYI